MEGHVSRDDEALSVMKARKGLYDFYASVFFEEPTADLLRGLCEQSGELEGAIASYATSLDGADFDAVRSNLAAEYARLFLNMGPHPVPPYESVYTSDLHLLMQEARDEVLAAYRDEHVTVVTDVHIPEDHVALEFDFMSKMCQKTIDALEAGDEEEADRCLDVQAAFVGAHLTRWVPALCDDVLAHANEPFYRAVAADAKLFVAEELVLLSDEEPKG